MKDERVIKYIRVRPDFWRELKKIAVEEDKTLQEVHELAISEYVQNKKSVLL